MARDIDKLLGAFKPRDYTVRLCEAIEKILPSAPELTFYGSLDEAVAALAPDAGPAVVHRARAICEGDGAQKVLTIADALDRADAGLSIYTGLSSAMKLYRDREDALRTDSRQAADAVLKGLGLSWMVHALFEGSFAEKVRAFTALDAGQHLATYYAAIEVGLPFADNAAGAMIGGGTGLVERLFSSHEAGQLERLAAVTGEEEAAQASQMAHALIGPMEGLVKDSAAHLSAIASAASEYATGAVGAADKVASVAATAADVLPVWRFLGARLVAEYAVKQAVAEVGLSRGAAVPVPLPESLPTPRTSRIVLLVAVAVSTLAAAGGIAAYLLGADDTADPIVAAPHIDAPAEDPDAAPPPTTDPPTDGAREKPKPHHPPRRKARPPPRGH